MTKDKRKKNVLDDLLNDELEEELDHGFEELSVLVYRGNRKTIEIPSGPDPPKTGKAASKSKKSAGKNISFTAEDNVSIELKDTAAKIKFMLPRNLKKKISMQKIVDYAVKAIVEELTSSSKQDK